MMTRPAVETGVSFLEDPAARELSVICLEVDEWVDAKAIEWEEHYRRAK